MALSTSIRSATQNVRGTPVMSQAAVVHDVRRAATNKQIDADIIGWQEMSKLRYGNAVKHLAGKVHKTAPDVYTSNHAAADGKLWSHYLPMTGKGNHKGYIEDPISWDSKKFDFVSAGTKLLSHGTHKPGFANPNRYATWVKLTDKKTGETFVRINTHFVNGAFAKGKSYQGWRQARLKDDEKNLAALVTRFKDQGLPVIVGGDLNATNLRRTPEGRHLDDLLRTDARHRLDWMLSTPSSNLQSHHGHTVNGFRSDHQDVVASYTLTRGHVKG